MAHSLVMDHSATYEAAGQRLLLTICNGLLDHGRNSFPAYPSRRAMR